MSRIARTSFPALLLGLSLLLVPRPAAAELPDGPTRLLRRPTMSAQHIAFEYANDIWVVPRSGGQARRITSFPGQETHPSISPDGRWIAFSAQYGGNTDVWVAGTEGGEPARLTWHPGGDVVQGWTPDGQRVVFASGRTNAPSGQKFWTVGLEADLPRALPMHRAHQGSFSPDGERFAYRMVSPWEDEWRNYRGGQNRPIWILELDDLDLTEVRPWDGSNDQDPVWVGETVYFLSDRDWAMNIWAYETATKELRQVTHYREFDVKNLDTDGSVLVFEHAGYVKTLDPAEGQERTVEITVKGDFPWLMPSWEDVSRRLTNPALGPTGQRVLFEARGEIFSVPADEGDWQNLTRTSGVADRTPAWSPDGRHVSWFSDASGEYRLIIASPDGMGERRVVELPDPTFYYEPAWSPDSEKILFTDTDLRLWVVEVASGEVTHVDTDQWMVPFRSVTPRWSPDSRYIAYAKRLDNLLHAVFVYDIEGGEIHQISDGMSDALSPAWDASGDYLYFQASTDFGLNTGWLDMMSYDRPTTSGLYVALLRRDQASPFLPEAGEEPVKGEEEEETGTEGTEGEETGVRIDFEGLQDRVIALGVTERNYSSVEAGPEGKLFFLESPRGGGQATLKRYDLEKDEAVDFLEGVYAYTLSADRKKLLYRQGSTWGVVDAGGGPPSRGAGSLDTSGIEMRVDPPAEFEQMFSEGWRFQRDYLYVPNMHGVDYEATKARYAPLVDHLAHRSDLNYLLDWMGGEVAIGHSFVRGGDAPDVDRVSVGLLGADLEISDGRYRIARIYTGEDWNPNLQGPLAVPGLGVAEGDFILAVDGQQLRAPANPYRHFENTAGRQVVLRVASDASGRDARDVRVVPTGSEAGLRRMAWVEGNRRKVDELSDGRLAYVWLPNTGQGGYQYFNRYYFAQQDREGAVVDERFNSGGSAADYIIEFLMREPHGYFNNPVGDRQPFTSPASGIWGPKVMIINENAGSGGDLMPYMFRYYEVGPLVGKRTWGGLVGTWDTPQLLDGGTMIAPRGGFFDIEGEWAVENEGVAPDIPVENTPKAMAEGRDLQLERAVQEALRLLRTEAFDRKEEPDFPIRSRRPPPGTRR
ncbi:MAG: PDZ domain-containing protein [bacterium]